MRYPDFFVVGAAKSGTTALWKYFQQHPDIFVTNDIAHKELGFFSDYYGLKDINEYLSFFKNAKINQKVGEVCHAYLTSPNSAKKISEYSPDAKIIMMLRNPIDRAYSLYNWMTMHGYEKASSFEKAIKKETKLLINPKSHELLQGYIYNYLYYNSGLYYAQVKDYLDIFKRENILILEYSDFLSDQRSCLSSIFSFLDVSTDINIRDQKTNISQKVLSKKLQYLARKKLINTSVHKKYQRRLFDLLMQKNIINKKPTGILSKTRNSLLAEYKEDVKLLSELTKIDFSNKWRI